MQDTMLLETNKARLMRKRIADFVEVDLMISGTAETTAAGGGLPEQIRQSPSSELRYLAGFR